MSINIAQVAELTRYSEVRTGPQAFTQTQIMHRTAQQQIYLKLDL